MKKNKKKSQIQYSVPTLKEQERLFKEQKRKFDTEREELKTRSEQLNQQKQLIDDLLHEVTKINNQLAQDVGHIDRVNRQANLYDAYAKEEINNSIQTLSALTSLFSIRLSLFNLLFEPSVADRGVETDMHVFRKIERAYKCLHYERSAKKIDIQLRGNSNLTFRLKSSMEIAFFIIIENAIKYSPSGEKIDIHFWEDGTGKLEVTFVNIARTPREDEMSHLTERGFRADVSRENGSISGNGIGLYLLSQICGYNNVKYNFSVIPEAKTIKGTEYQKFAVSLSFSKR